MINDNFFILLMLTEHLYSVNETLSHWCQTMFLSIDLSLSLCLINSPGPLFSSEASIKEMAGRPTNVSIAFEIIQTSVQIGQFLCFDDLCLISESVFVGMVVSLLTQ